MNVARKNVLAILYGRSLNLRVLNIILSKTFLLLEKTDECIIEMKRLIQNSTKDYNSWQF